MSNGDEAEFKVVHAQDEVANEDFPPNLIKTSRYNPVTFVPVFLLEQLNPRNKFANFYFFCVAILQMVPAISITGGLPSVLVPLLFVLFVEVRPPLRRAHPLQSRYRGDCLLFRLAWAASFPAAGCTRRCGNPHPRCHSSRA